MSSRSVIRAVKKQAAEATVYSWTAGPSIPIKADVAMRELTEINKTVGYLVAEDVVQAAAPEGSALHPAFEWDDHHAADKYRLQQAGHLLRSLVVSVRREDGSLTEPVRAIVSVTRASVEEGEADEDVAPLYTPRVYVPVLSVVTEEDARRRYVLRAYQELQIWRKRYKDVVAFAHIFEEIDRLSETVAS